MYLPKAFEITDLPTLHDFMADYSFATIVSQHEGAITATHIPIWIEREGSQYGRLWGHLSRANPQWHDFSEGEVLVIFQGPHSYVSPSWYEAAANVPTWNYTAVHAYGRVRLIEDYQELYSLIEKVVIQNEAPREKPWALTDAPVEHLEKTMRGVVGFEIEITRLEGKYKLSQNRPANDRENVIQELEKGHDLARQTAAIMRSRK